MYLSDALLVGCLEVLSHSDLPALILEHTSHRVRIEVNILNIVGALVAPVCDDGLSLELLADTLVPLLQIFGAPLQLDNALEASRSRHELEDGVHDEGTADLALEGRSLKTLPDHKACSTVNRVRDIKEARGLADLLKLGVTESRLDDDVEQVLGDRVVRIVELLAQSH